MIYDIYIYFFIHTYIHTYIFIYIYIYLAFIYVSKYTYICLYMYKLSCMTINSVRDSDSESVVLILFCVSYIRKS